MLILTLRPSRLLAALLVLLYGGAVASVVAVPLPLWLKAFFILAIVASGFHAVRLHALGLPAHAAAALEIDDECTVRVVARSGEVEAARLLPDSFVTPWLTVLNLRNEAKRRRSVLITPDRVDAESYRRLRVLLRWRCAKGEESPGI